MYLLDTDQGCTYSEANTAAPGPSAIHDLCLSTLYCASYAATLPRTMCLTLSTGVVDKAERRSRLWRSRRSPSLSVAYLKSDQLIYYCTLLL